MADAHLYIANKNYSSWSMRPWLALRWAGIAFRETLIPLGEVGGAPNPGILAVSPSGKVPALEIDGLLIWDSIAICEWAAEQAPALWPAEARARAVARAAAAEMHSGFQALRRDLPMNVRRRASARAWPEETARDIARVQALWGDLRARFGADGPFLFGAKSIADAMFAPVCTRFRTYGVSLEAVSAAYCEAIFADLDFRAWEAAALAEPMSLARTDNV